MPDEELEGIKYVSSKSAHVEPKLWYVYKDKQAESVSLEPSRFRSTRTTPCMGSSIRLSQGTEDIMCKKSLRVNSYSTSTNDPSPKTDDDLS